MPKWVYIQRTGFANLSTLTIAFWATISAGFQVREYNLGRYENTDRRG